MTPGMNPTSCVSFPIQASHLTTIRFTSAETNFLAQSTWFCLRILVSG